ncbi:MAG: ATP synthase F1 subunit gamma [Bacteroidota bacterium]
MPKTKKILDRIQAIGATKKITQAMKMVAVAKLGKVKERLHRERNYIDSYLALFEEVLALQKERPSSPLLAVRPIKKVLLLCLTTDRGLCGAFNQHVLKKTIAQYEAYSEEGVTVDLLPIGQKGFDFLHKVPLPCLEGYVNISFDKATEKLGAMTDFLTMSFTEKKYDRITLIYQSSKTADVEKITVLDLLPIVLPPPSVEERDDPYLYEPSPQAIIKEMLPHIVRNKLYKAWLEGSVAEQSVRMLVTSQATDNAEKLLKELRLSYNRSRQSAITRSISEIVAGSNSMK